MGLNCRFGFIFVFVFYVLCGFGFFGFLFGVGRMRSRVGFLAGVFSVDIFGFVFGSCSIGIFVCVSCGILG